MSVDKFGRHSHRSFVAQKGLKGEGFHLTPLGDYDVLNRRLQRVNDPAEDGDAVNLKTFHLGLSRCVQLTTDSTCFDAQLRRINNAGDPIERSDLVTKGFLEESVPLRDQQRKAYSVHQFTLKDLAYPENGGDAVNLNYISNNCLLRNGDKVFDANGGTIRNLKDPTKGPEVATKTYVDAHTPVKKNNYWSFGNKRLVSVAGPINPNDVTTLDYVTRQTLCLEKTSVAYDAKKKTIANVGKPRDLDDVVSKRYLKEVLADLGYSVYANLHRGRANIMPADQWKAKVLESGWDELFV